MTADRPSKTALVLKIAGAVAIIGASKVLFRGFTGKSGHDGNGETAVNHVSHSRRSDMITYGIGYLLSLVLTCIVFALVHRRWASGPTALGIVFALALVQTIVQFRCFLHIDLKRSARDDLQLIVFSTVIIALMVGGTLVVLLNLRMRMM